MSNVLHIQQMHDVHAHAKLAMSNPDSVNALNSIVRLACRYCDAPYGAFSIVGNDAGYMVACYGLPANLSLWYDTSYVVSAFKGNEPIIIADTLSDERYMEISVMPPPVDISCITFVPVFGIRGDIIGTLAVADSVYKPLPADYIDTLQILAGQITKLIELTEIKNNAVNEGSHTCKASEHLNQLIRYSSDMITVISSEGVILSKSPVVERVLGYDYGELVGKSIFDLVHPDDAPILRQFQIKAMSTPGISQPFQFRIRSKQNDWLFLESIVNNLLEDEELRAIVVNSRDVTERRQTEGALLQANQKLQALVEASPLAIVAIDMSACVTLWNPAAERLFGWSSTEVIGEGHPFVRNDLVNEQRLIVDQLLEGKSLSDIELTRWTKSGDTVDVRLSADALRDVKGDTVGAILIYVDVTEQKRMAEQLLQTNKMESIGRLAGGIAHDFNNLLTAIIGYTQLADSTIPCSSTAKPYLQNVRQAAERAASLTHQLLAFARKQIIAPKVINLNELFDNLSDLLRHMLGEQISLETSTCPNLGLVRVDPNQMEQVLLNLAANARDAMPEGGRLVIKTENVSIPAGHKCSCNDITTGEYVRITIADNGEGMAKAVSARVFEPFFTTKEQGRGTGLGLATCYGIIKQSGGFIYVTSVVDEGTEFEVFLPRIDRPTVSSEPGKQANIVRGGETILLVENETLVRGIVVQALRSLGYTVIEAVSGENALSVAQHTIGPLHLLLTDIIMPGMGGRKLAELLHAQHPNLQVLFMSGYTDGAIGNENDLPEGWGFIRKPFTPSSLVAKIRAILDN